MMAPWIPYMNRFRRSVRFAQDGNPCFRVGRQLLLSLFVLGGGLAIGLLPSDSRGDEYVSNAFGKTYKFRVTSDAIERAPKWLQTEDNPPLPPRKALTIAQDLADKLIGKRVEYRREFERNGLVLQSTQGGWLWIIRFEWHLIEGGESGIPNHLVVPVPMDGNVLEPDVRTGHFGDSAFETAPVPVEGC